MRILLAICLLFVSACDDMSAQQELKIGSMAPEFSAQDQHGNTITLKESLKSGPVVLVFYRGAWCPYCNLHMSALADSIDLFKPYNATVVAITPENFEEIKKMEEKTGLNFSVIWDKEHKIMDAYKVTWHLGGLKRVFKFFQGVSIQKRTGNKDRALPVPATYIINQDGKIIGAHFDNDHHARMPVGSMLRVLEEHR